MKNTKLLAVNLEQSFKRTKCSAPDVTAFKHISQVSHAFYFIFIFLSKATLN